MNLPPGRPAPPGAAIFLDPQEGWLWSATEAASQKTSLYEPAFWPIVARRDLPACLGDAGLGFLWLQEPDPSRATLRLLAEHFLSTEGRLLVVGDSPADLEPLADLPGAIYTGEALADSPLGRASIDAETDRRRLAREARLAEIHREISELKGAESAQRARLELWADLSALEGRFIDLGRNLDRRSREWAKIRRVAAERQAAWEAAAKKAGKFMGRPSRLLGWFRDWLGRSLIRTEERRRQKLEEAEEAVREVRRAEEAAFKEAQDLSERLNRMRQESASWTPQAELTAKLKLLAEEHKAAVEALAVESARPLPEPDRLLAEAALVLALAADAAESGGPFPVVLRMTSLRPDPTARQNLSALVLKAEKHLVIMGDFTFWPVWSGRAPAIPEAPSRPAWWGFKVAEEANELKEFLASGGLFHPGPSKVPAPRLARLELGRAVGLGLRAFGEMGPVNPVSALAVARAAWDFASSRPERPAALVLTASSAQGRLIELMLEDLKAPSGLVLAGEPEAFNGGPRAPLVILEPAYEAPHQGHPWAWPTFGRWRLQLAWDLAREEIWLVGRDEWLSRLPAAAPLATLWRAAEPGRVPGPVLEKLPENTVRSIMDLARTEIWAFLPSPGESWWPAWEAPLMTAARRRLAVTVLSAPPGSGDDSDFASAALRRLGTNNCTVGLATGFPGFLAGVDGRYLIWAAEGTPPQAVHLPLAAKALAEILQLPLIIEKAGRRGGGLRLCRLCGRPLLLINQSQLRGLGDEQPLKVGCLGCPAANSQRLNERRDPFTAPPKCGLDILISYQRQGQGRQEVWACPSHPGGPSCPSYRVIPGDCP